MCNTRTDFCLVGVFFILPTFIYFFISKIGEIIVDRIIARTNLLFGGQNMIYIMDEKVILGDGYSRKRLYKMNSVKFRAIIKKNYFSYTCVTKFYFF